MTDAQAWAGLFIILFAFVGGFAFGRMSGYLWR